MRNLFYKVHNLVVHNQYKHSLLSLPTAGATAVTVPLAAKSVPEEGTEGKENPPNAPRLGVLAGTDTAGVLTGRLNPAKPPIVDKIV